jgi:hypothetical protein
MCLCSFNYEGVGGQNVKDRYDLAGPAKSNTSNDYFGALDHVRPSALLVAVLLLNIL